MEILSVGILFSGAYSIWLKPALVLIVNDVVNVLALVGQWVNVSEVIEMYHKYNNQKGFTLIEIVIVIAVLGIITAIALPLSAGSVERGRITADQATVRTLNDVTTLYQLNKAVEDPFLDENNSNADLLEVLVSSGYLTASVEPQTKDAAFEWSFKQNQWLLIIDGTLETIFTADEHFTVHSTRADEIVAYDEEAGEHLLIPGKIDGTYIKKIVGQGGEGAFESKGLESVMLPESLTTIGNRAFLDNNLSSIELPEGILEIGISSFSGNQITEITIPNGVTSVGASAFHENPINKIVIGDGVSIGSTYSFGIHRPGGGGNFDQVYTSENGGAGTYIWNGESWLKQ
jgi:prepilin-type N-terminal cleavage/methylation domain-containing protein